MTGRSPSFVQKLARVFMSRESYAAAEAESRSWNATCPDCGLMRSIWELGGIRHLAAGKPSMLMRCSNCGARSWHRIERIGGG